MKYAFIELSLHQQIDRPLLKALLFERKEKNSFGLIINKSLITSSYYEELLFQLIDGKYSISYVNDENQDEYKIFENKYPFANINEYMKKFNNLPIKITYLEKLVNSFDEVSELVNYFTSQEDEEIAYLNNFTYSNLLKRGKLANHLETGCINIKEKISNILSEDIAEVSFTVENFYENIGLNTVPVKFIAKLKDFIDDFIDFNRSQSQLSKANVSFANNCVKTTIHLPKTTTVKDNVEYFANNVKNINNDNISDIVITNDNMNIYQSITEILKISDINDLKIDVKGFDISVKIDKKDSIKLEKKVLSYKQQIRSAQEIDFKKFVIPYEVNTYNNSFIAIDENLNHYTYYISPEIFEDLWVVKDKFIPMNAKELEKMLKDENEVNFKTFKKHWIEVEGKYRNSTVADTSKIIYVIASEID